MTETEQTADQVREEVREQLRKVGETQGRRVFAGLRTMLVTQGAVIKSAVALGAVAATAFGALVADASREVKEEAAKAKAKLAAAEGKG